MTRGAALLSAALVAACARSPASPGAAGPRWCDARARVTRERPLLLDVDVRCHGAGFTGFVASEPASLAHISDRTSRIGPTEARTSYRVDLDALAAQSGSFDVALRSGSSLVAPVSTWLVRPEPHTTDVPVRLRVETPKGFGFATGLTREGGDYRLDAHEIPVGTYALFGQFDSRTLAVGDSRITLAFTDGRLAAGPDEVARWVADSARAVADFWHGFPVPRVQITVIVVPGRDRVVFGKVLPESAPGIALLVGENTPRQALYQDWILVHELFHLGVPSFSGEGKWFDEGLATYFEPIIRARAGFISEESVWEEFTRAMPRGLHAVERQGVERAEDFSGVYWGGAILVMLADLEVRRHSAGARGLEDGLRGVRAAGGHASEVWPLERALALCDRATGVRALAPLAAAHAQRGRPVDLDALWRQLGVVSGAGGMRFDDRAPLSAVRRSVVGRSASAKLGSAPTQKPNPAL